jgi:hypothetical protein
MIESDDDGMTPMVIDRTRRIRCGRQADCEAGVAWTWLRVQAYYEQQNDE